MNERTITIVAVAALALIVILGGVSIYFLHSNLSEKQKQANNLREEVRKAEQKKSEIKTLETKLNDMQAKIKLAEVTIPMLDDSEYDDLAELIDTLRKQANVDIKDAKFESPRGGGPAAAIPPSMHKAQYSINLSGPFYNLVRFINLLEADKRFVGVQTFSIGGKDDEDALLAGPFPIRTMKLQIFSFTRDPRKMPGMPQAAAQTPQAAEADRKQESTPIPN